jgi:hypothetical protein
MKGMSGIFSLVCISTNPQDVWENIFAVSYNKTTIEKMKWRCEQSFRRSLCYFRIDENTGILKVKVWDRSKDSYSFACKLDNSDGASLFCLSTTTEYGTNHLLVDIGENDYDYIEYLFEEGIGGTAKHDISNNAIEFDKFYDGTILNA